MITPLPSHSQSRDYATGYPLIWKKYISLVVMVANNSFRRRLVYLTCERLLYSFGMLVSFIQIASLQGLFLNHCIDAVDYKRKNRIATEITIFVA